MGWKRNTGLLSKESRGDLFMLVSYEGVKTWAGWLLTEVPPEGLKVEEGFTTRGEK